MGSVPGRAKRVESVISIFLLAVLFLIGAVIFVKQSDYDTGRFGISAAALPEPEAASKLGEIVPGGFEALSKTEVYNSETLYEKIDGKAPLYLESGFRKLSTQRFVNINNTELWMELYVYDMGEIKNAFSVYSVQRRAEAEKVASMQFAYKTSNALYFVLGRYYTEIVGSAESAELLAAMEEVAQTLETNLDVGDTEIAEFEMFPKDNLVSDSFKLYTVSAFGFEGLTDTFTAKYKFDGENVTAFISKRIDFEDAENIAENYGSFLIENGAVIQSTDEALTGKILDLYGMTEIVFAVGPFVAGVHEAENQETAKKLAVILINKLNDE